ncbi:CDP-alcohol phosphatidyltransferase superfamily protein [Melioribacter roseus P3M-2]|uniref:CDP-alcohol phosphatidyltransferase superfamily protein n=2 Tax=Melioribacteraceae TaxID=1334117 RepID=I6YVC9_MELRP|nr:CDP-alcohol phosphatidyltransferase superfamily protein [Melioribacter roseus P3M-2]
MALAARSLGLTPNAVTLISVIFGVAAGHLFFYQNTTVNWIGVLFLVIAEALDGADGQLARMTNTHSRYGRIFDGVAGNLWFISIYLHMSARFVAEGGSPYIFLIAVLAGLSHSFQSAMADFYRVFYLYFVQGKDKDIDDISEVKNTYSGLSWSKSPFKKFLLRVYINYIREQYLLAKKVRELFSYVKDNLSGRVPEWFRSEYRKLNKPMIKYQNILTTNTRMIVLFITVFLGNILHYFLFELIILNAVLVYFVIKEEAIHNYLLDVIKRGK